MEKKMFGHRLKKRPSDDYRADFSKKGKSEDNPPGYEGKEHVKYKNPGFSKHEIKFPEDEPHMKSSVSKNEMHEMEDNYHMDVPDQTEYSLEAKLKRAKMKMDAPDQEDPDKLQGNIVHNVSEEGEEDTSGEEQMGPNNMQKGSGSKNRRRDVVVSVMKRKIAKGNY